ncbi:MAG: metallophosphoesterase family protein [Tepidisphaeraceae bacterium]
MYKPIPRDFDCLVVSDLHLGAPNCHAGDFLRFMDWSLAPRLIIAGDLFEHDRFHSLDRSDLRVIETLRSYARTNSVTWVRGNHDPSDRDCKSILGLTTRDETIIESDRARYLVKHGHEWDPSMKLSWLVSTADVCYQAAQAIDRSHRLARFLKRKCKRLTRTVDTLQRRAVEEARRRCFDGVIVGHTHQARDTRHDGVHYLNSGCWTENPSSFIGIRDGVTRHYFWDHQAHQPAAIECDALPSPCEPTLVLEAT